MTLTAGKTPLAALGDDTFSLAKAVLDLVNSKRIFTDIHVQENSPIRIMTPRGWVQASSDEVMREDIHAFLERLDANWLEKIKSPEGAFDRPITLSQARLRCNAYRCGDTDALSIAIRRLSRNVPTVEQLGLPTKTTDEMIRRGKGLILITGATGSGKTTTQAALLQAINKMRSAHIITIEEPIEYVLEEDKCIISQREVPTNVADFRSGLQSALRQKPNVIMVGEIRNKETMEIVLHAAESGHLVFATLHTNSAEGAIGKVLSYFEGDEMQKRQMLSSVLIGVISQVLLPAVNEDRFVLAHEVLMNSPVIARAIRDGKASSGGPSMVSMEGCVPLNKILLEMCDSKLIDVRDAVSASYDPDQLREALKNKRLSGASN